MSFRGLWTLTLLPIVIAQTQTSRPSTTTAGGGIADRKQLQSVLDKLAAADAAGDYSTWKQLMQDNTTPQFKLIEPRGKSLGLSQVLRNEQQSIAEESGHPSEHSTVETFNTTGNTTTATVNTQWTGSAVDTHGVYGAAGKVHALSIRSTYVYQLNKDKAGAWKIASVTITSQSETVDGRPWPPKRATPRNLRPPRTTRYPGYSRYLGYPGYPRVPRYPRTRYRPVFPYRY